MSEAAGIPLTVQEVTDIISKAKSAAVNPVLIGMQIFKDLGDEVTLSGDTLRLALANSALPIGGPMGTFVSAIQTVSKTGSHVSTENSEEIETTLNGTRIRFKQEVSFEVTESSGSPGLQNIIGVAAHSVIWIDIKGLQLRENQEHWSLDVVTPLKTINFNLS